MRVSADTRSTLPASETSKHACPRLYCAILAVVILTAFAVSFSLALARGPRVAADLQNDSVGYHQLATSILSRFSYEKCTFQAPGYPAFLALVYAVAGAQRMWPVYLVQAMLFAACLLLVYGISLRITQNAGMSILAVCACATWWRFYKIVGEVMTETLAAVLVAASVYVLLLAIRKPTWSRCALLGLLMGCGAFTKGPFLLFIPVAVLFIAFTGDERARRLSAAVLTLACAGILIVPWTVRNHRLTGEIIPVQTGGGFNLWCGNWPQYYVTQYPVLRWNLDHFPPPLNRMMRGKTEIEQEHILARQGWHYIRQRPLRAARIFAFKFSELWLGRLGVDPRMYSDPPPSIKRFGIPRDAVIRVTLLIAAVFGWLWLPADAHRRSYPVLALLAAWSIPYILTLSISRYSDPVTFYEMIFASAAVWLWVERRLRPRRLREA